MVPVHSLNIMAKRKSLNKRFSRYSKSGGGSDVLNPDTNVLDDEQPYWWRNLENNTIARPSTGSVNCNQSTRHLNSNLSIRTSNDLEDGWWKVLEDTPRNLKSLQKGNDLSKKDANDGAPGISESEEEVKIVKKKPPLWSEVKKVDGNAFLSALNDSRVVLIPLEKDPAFMRSSFVQKFALTSQISNDSKQLNKDYDTELRMTENGHDLLNSLPKASSTPLESSIPLQQTSMDNSYNDTQPVVKKPRSKLLRRHNKDTKKNLFENILMKNKIDEEEAADRLFPKTNALVHKSVEEPEPRIVEDESKLGNANAKKRLHPTEKTDLQDSNDSSDTMSDFLKPAKSKSRFFKQTRRSPRENLFQRIFDDSDSWTTKAVSNPSQNSNGMQTMRRPSAISTESNNYSEDINLRLSNSTNPSDVDIIRTDNNKVSNSRNSYVEIASSQLKYQVSNAVETSRKRSVLSNEDENDKNSDVTLLTQVSRSPSMLSRSTDRISVQLEACLRHQSEQNSGADEEAIASLRNDSADAENVDDPSDIEFRDSNRSRKRSMSRCSDEIRAKQSPINQRTMKLQEHSGTAIFNEERTEHDEEAASRRSRSLSRLRKESVSRAESVSEVEQSARTTSRRQSNRSTTARQQISFTANDEKTCEFENTTLKRSKRSDAARRTSETENVQTPKRESRNVKRSVSRIINEIEPEVSESSLTKSKTHVQVVTPVKANAPVEIEDVPLRPSQRLSRTRKGASQTLASESVVEDSQTPTKRQSKRTSTGLAQVLTPVKENAPVGIEHMPMRSSKSLSRTREGTSHNLTTESQIEDSQTPAKKQKKQTSTGLEQVSTPVKGNVLVEIEEMPMRPSQNLSGTRKGASQTLASQSEIEDSQTPTKRQSKRTSKGLEQVLSPVKGNTLVEIDEMPMRPSQNLSGTRKGASQTLASQSEIEDSQTPTKRQSKRTSKGLEQVLSPIKENALVEIVNILMRPNQRLSRTRKGASQTLASESVVEDSQTPTKRQSKRTSTGLAQVLTPVKENAPVGIEHMPMRSSKSLSRTREGTSHNLTTESQIEDSQTPAKKQKKQTSTGLEQVSTPVKGNVLVEIEEMPMSPSQSLSGTRKGASQNLVSESQTEDIQTPVKRQSKRTSTGLEKVLTPVKENHLVEIEDISMRPNQRLSRTRKGASQTLASQSEVEDSQTPTKRQSKRRSKGLEQLSPPVKGNTLVEIDEMPMRVSQNLSGTRKGASQTLASQSEVEDSQTPTKRQSKRRSKGLEQLSPPVKGNTLVEIDEMPMRPSQNLSGTRKGASQTLASQSEVEDSQTPTKRQSKRRSKGLEQLSTLVKGNTLVEIDEMPMRPSQNLSGTRKGASQTLASQSEIEDSQTPTKRQSKRTSKGLEQVLTPVKENGLVEIEDIPMRPNQRLSRTRKGASQTLAGQSEVEDSQTPTKRQSKRTSKDLKLALTPVKENVPVEIEDMPTRPSQRLSRVRKGRSMVISSDSEVEGTQSPSRKERGRTSNVQNQIASIDADDASPGPSQRLSRARKGRSLAIFSESEVEGSQSPSRKGTGQTSNVQVHVAPIDADDASPGPSQRLSRARRGRSLAVSSESEDEGRQSSSTKERGRTSKVEEQIIPIEAEDIAPGPSQSLSIDRNRHSLAISSESEDEGRQSSSTKGRGRTSKLQWSVSPIEAEDNVPGPSQSLSRDRKGRSLAISSESEDEGRQSSSRKGTGKTSKVQMHIAPIGVEDILPRPSQSLNRDRKERSLAISSESEDEGRQSSSRKGTGKTSKVQVHIAPIGVEDILPRPSQSLNRDRKGRSLAISSESEDEGRQSSSRKGTGKTSKVQVHIAPIGAEDIAPGPSHRLVETQIVPPLQRPGPGKAKSSTAPRESQKGQRNIQDFFKTNMTTSASTALSNPQTAQEIRKKVDEMKKRELDRIEEIRKLSVLKEKNKFGKGSRSQPKRKNLVPRKVDKAYLINGMMYKQPRLPRPKRWVTDYLYRHLWKRMEPKYKLETRVVSENFIRYLSEVCDVIAKSKSYLSYKDELYKLMMEMARLQIIQNRHDFYHFCQDFLPYELRVKMVPILLPGNQRTIPYNPDKLHQPLISP